MIPRMIYTGIRVKDMEESIKFYTEILEMKLIERKKTPQTHGEKPSSSWSGRRCLARCALGIGRRRTRVLCHGFD